MPEKEFATNMSTTALKIIACISMLVDHVGLVFFPGQLIFRLVGRLAFPLFCYCMTVGMVYTKNIKKYLMRLLVFAFVSQVIYIFAFYGELKTGEIAKLSVFFTLLLSLLAVWGFKEGKYWLFAVSVLLSLIFDVDYSAYGIVLVLLFYLCRNKPALGAALFVVSFMPYCFYNPLIAAITALLIFAQMDINIRISKWFFYAFYPAHLLVIAILRNI